MQKLYKPALMQKITVSICLLFTCLNDNYTRQKKFSCLYTEKRQNSTI